MSWLRLTSVPVGIPLDGAIRAFAVDGPRAGDLVDPDGFVLDGWALGTDVPVEAAEVWAGTERRGRIPADRGRPDVAAAYPDATGAERSGFRGWVAAAGLPSPFALCVIARLADGGRIELGAITGERLPFVAPAAPAAEALAAWHGPDFLIIGAQRGGTTSLYHYLSQHPNVAPAATKEVRFLTTLYDRGTAWYRAQFPATPAAGDVTGEATPYALFHPLAPRRAALVAPNAKLIVLLRHPVDRALSHYHHECALGIEPLPFAEAIEREAERLAGERERLLADETYASFSHQHFSYLARGRYAEQLDAWLAHFPRERLLFLRSEDLYRDQPGTVRRVTDFLGLAPAALSDRRPLNQIPHSQLDPETRRQLEVRFAEENRRLVELFGEAPW